MILLGRALFGVCLLSAWLFDLRTTLAAHDFPFSDGSFFLKIRRDARALLSLVFTVVFSSATILFVLRLHQAAAGACVFALLAAIRQLQLKAWPERPGFHGPAAASLAAYLLAFLATAGSAAPYREACGWEAAAGVIAAAYSLAGLSKVKGSGTAWMKGGNLGLLIAERAHGAPAAVEALRLYVAGAPRLCRALAGFALLVQVGAFLFVLRGARAPLTVALTLFHLVGTPLLLGYLEFEWMLIAVAVTLGSAASF